MRLLRYLPTGFSAMFFWLQAHEHRNNYSSIEVAMFGTTFSYRLQIPIIVHCANDFKLMKIVSLTMLCDTSANSPGVSFFVLITAPITADLTALSEVTMMLFLQNKARLKS